MDKQLLGLISTIIVIIIIALVKAATHDPNRWYGKMACLRCGYRWQSRRSTPPSRCASCGSHNIVTQTDNSSVPAIPATPINQPQEVRVALLDSEGKEIGINYFFDPMDNATEMECIKIVSRNVLQQSAGEDELIRFLFKTKFKRVEGMTAEMLKANGCPEEEAEIFRRNQKEFLLGLPEVISTMRMVAISYIDNAAKNLSDLRRELATAPLEPSVTMSDQDRLRTISTSLERDELYIQALFIITELVLQL